MTRASRISARRGNTSILRQLATLPPYERAIEAKRLGEQAKQFQHELSVVRSDAATTLKAQGLTWREVGELLGLAPTSVMELSQRRRRKGCTEATR